ncbi:TonB-dependent receptor [Aestuariicella hydrocarbonica]|uniref:TonB-dependent receptor n=1 Tax=Pseudomaricurvus hydrocarbonicus TaxID=1470433 RepID=A0A9E5T3L2_9GAMM|nr:TonB-dependent receptor plug domain-containing protein [Aestuariicella hydrocarbonica]NHO67263.1 TonB-dependent receptor [Aestuariicella hydrocarbonica]
MEEVIVTARKREETLQDIPLAINAFTAKDIERSGMQDMRDIVRKSPGLVYDSSGTMATGNISIRGMSQPGLIGDDTNVAVFVDGVYASGRAASFIPMMGLERVEVVRGPQSAIYGRNAFSGAMNYITAKPGDEFEAQVEVTGGTDGQRGIKGRVEVPVHKTLAFSLDLENTETGSTFKQDDTYMGAIDNESQRLRVVFTPIDSLEFDFSATHIDMQEHHNAGYEITSNAEHEAAINTAVTGGAPFLIPGLHYTPGLNTLTPLGMAAVTGPATAYYGEIEAEDPDGFVDGAFGVTNKSDRYNLSVNWYHDDFTISSITANSETETRSLQGYANAYNGQTMVFAPVIAVNTGFGPVTPTTLMPNYVTTLNLGGASAYILNVDAYNYGGQPNDDREEFSQELRIQSSGSGPWEWSAGLLYADIELDQWLTSSAIPASGSVYGDDINAATIASSILSVDANGDPQKITQTNHNTKIQSAFFSLAYDFTDKLNVGIEARYTKEEKEADNVLHFTGAQGLKEGSWDWVSPRLIATYEYDDFTTFYLNIAKGTKSGGINGGTPIASELTYEPETNITYEFGAKRTVLNGRGYMNIAAYKIDWEDQQLRQFSQYTTGATIPSAIVTNLGEVEIKGIEIETAFQISDAWTFRAAYTFNDTEVKKGFQSATFGYVDYEEMGLNATNYPYCFNVAGGDCVVMNNLQVSDGDLSGKEMVNNYRNTFNTGFRYSKQLSFGAELYADLSAVWRDKRYINTVNTLSIEDHWDVNFLAGLEAEHWYGKLTITNLLDDDTPTTSFRPYLWTQEQQPTIVNRMGRMTSLTVGYRF